MKRKSPPASVPLRVVRALFRELEAKIETRITELVKTLVIDRGSIDFVMAERRAEGTVLSARVTSLEEWKGKTDPELERLGSEMKRLAEIPIALRAGARQA